MKKQFKKFLKKQLTKFYYWLRIRWNLTDVHLLHLYWALVCYLYGIVHFFFEWWWWWRRR